MTAGRTGRCVALGLFLAVLPSASPAASAATIELVLATRLVIEATVMRVELDLRNQGDATALNLAPTVEFQSRIVAGPGLSVLQPSSLQTVSIDVPLADGRPVGRWPVLIRLGYSDGDGVRFEAIHVDVAAFGGGVTSPVRVEVPDVHVETEATFQVQVDRGDVAEPIRLAFAAPAGLVVLPRVITSAAGEDPGALSVTVTNAGAAQPSRLPLVTLAEFDRNGVHETVAVVSLVEVGPAAARSRMQVTVILLVLTLVVGLLIAIAARRRQSAGRMR